MLTELLNKRRSYRDFQQKPVSRDTVRELILAANKAPVSCNLQLTQFVVVDDPTLRDALTKRVSYKFAYAPATIVVLYDPRFTVEHDSAVMTAGMQVENIILRATELGLATCPMAGFGKDHIIKELLHIPPPMEILLLVAVGYPGEHHPYPIQKLPLEETYRYNKYDLEDEVLNGSPYLEDHTPASLIEYRSRISSVYLDRFRLRTYDDSYYKDAFRSFEKEVLQGNVTSVLDLMSYDGLFIQMLREAHPGISVTASDYVAHNLDFFSSRLGVQTVLISAQNELSAREHDAVSSVFQSDFTPELQALLISAAAALKEHGLFFVATIEESWYRGLRAALHRWLRLLRGKQFNIYEGNPFYKVGPRSPVSMKSIEQYLHNANCIKVKDVVAASYPSRGRRVRCAVFQKQQ